MDTVILAAFELETEPIAHALKLKGPTPYGVTKVWVGKDIKLVQTNVGKVHAAAVTQYVIDHEHPNLIINVGISGGFVNEVSLGEVVMPTHVIQYDADQTKIGYPLGWIQKIEMIKFPITTLRNNKIWKKGICITADKILSDKKEGDVLYKRFHPSVVDMELGAIAQVCFMHNVNLMALKSPVDIVEKEEVASFESRIEASMKQLTEALRVVISIL